MSDVPARSDAPAPRLPRRRGPRRAGVDTRGAVLAAARARFAAHGYEGTKLRDVAADADVDVALVSYHFGSKDGLFTAALAVEVNPAQFVGGLTAEGVDGIGERLIRRILTLLDGNGAPQYLALVRSAATNAQAATLLRGFVEREVLGRIAAVIDAPGAEFRAGLAGSQVIGVIMARYVVGVKPIAEADPDVLAQAVGPTLQRYLTGDLAT